MGGKKRKQPASREQWYGEGGAMERWEKQLKDRGAFFDETDPGFQEFVSREHIDGRIPVAQLARGYSLSGSLIARWVKASLAKRGR